MARTVIFICMKMIINNCAHCGREISMEKKRHTYLIKKGRKQFYCSPQCSSTKHKPITRKCLYCNKDFQSSTKKKHKTCCSSKCASAYSRSYVDYTKVSEKLKKYQESIGHKIGAEKRVCQECGNMFVVEYHSTKKIFCGNSCASKNRHKNPEYKKNAEKILKQTREKMIMDGTWTVWRKRVGMSYPEKYFCEVLNNRNIKYEYNKPFEIYNIDFAINDKKIALEIDGQQHEKPERKLSDEKKDKALKTSGWHVYRIKWKPPITKGGKKYIENEILKFEQFYASVAQLVSAPH